MENPFHINYKFSSVFPLKKQEIIALWMYQILTQHVVENYALCFIWQFISTRRSGEESDVESSRESSCGGSSDCEADRQSKSADGKWNQHNQLNADAQQLNRISLRDKSALNVSVDEAEINKSPEALLFEYLEQEQPYNRRPLTDKVKQ